MMEFRSVLATACAVTGKYRKQHKLTTSKNYQSLGCSVVTMVTDTNNSAVDVHAADGLSLRKIMCEWAQRGRPPIQLFSRSI